MYDEHHPKIKLSYPRYSSDQLEELFEKETEVDVLRCVRTIANMSGIHNICGYYPILSQIDQSCSSGELKKKEEEAKKKLEKEKNEEFIKEGMRGVTFPMKKLVQKKALER